jgi:hypothetical protein
MRPFNRRHRPLSRPLPWHTPGYTSHGRYPPLGVRLFASEGPIGYSSDHVGVSKTQLSVALRVCRFQSKRPALRPFLRWRGGAEARHEQCEEPATGHKGNWRVSFSALGTVCGCINKSLTDVRYGVVGGAYPSRLRFPSAYSPSTNTST